eukprot:2683008-Pyramimonas_sp.AAC.1
MHSVESFYIACGMKEASQVYYEVLTGKKPVNMIKKRLDVLDVDEETESYDEKMGGWSRDAGLAASARHWT